MSRRHVGSRRFGVGHAETADVILRFAVCTETCNEVMRRHALGTVMMEGRTDMVHDGQSPTSRIGNKKGCI